MPHCLQPAHRPIKIPRVQESARYIRQHRLRERLIATTLVAREIDLRAPAGCYRRVVKTRNRRLNTGSGERDFGEVQVDLRGHVVRLCWAVDGL